MIVVPFKAEHFFAMTPQPAQAYVRDYVSVEQLRHLETPNSFTCMAGGEVVGCMGWWEVFPTRAVVWAYLSAHAGTHMVGLNREARRIVGSIPHARVETEVDCDFEQGHRWMKMLGFKQEVPRLRCYRVDGGDVAIYSMVR